MATQPNAITVEDPHSAPAHAHDDHGHGHHDPNRPAHLKSYFVSSEQQFEASKMGMWIFLVTEILLFGGMFVAYAIYRSWYPELFAEASTQLDTNLGFANTLVLLASSLTMAWAIQAIKAGKQRLMNIMLVTTVVLAGAFLVVKYFEYTHKFDLGIYPGKYFVYPEGFESTLYPAGGAVTPFVAGAVSADELGSRLLVLRTASPVRSMDDADPSVTQSDAPVVDPADVGTAGAGLVDPGAPHGEHNAPHEGPTADHGDGEHHYEKGGHGITNPRAGIFFSIYYVMTGIHGIHILIGIIAIGLLAFKGARGKYSAAWYTPVENVGLYWHVVDIIWIFLFPLMYLI